MKIAAIDIGSNSIHLIIAQVCSSGLIEIIDQAKEMAKLGLGTLKTGKLSDTAMDRGLLAIMRFQKIIQYHNVDTVEIVATSAIRESENGGAFIEKIKAETNWNVKIISGKDESRLIYLGARDIINFQNKKALIVDIGGGSVEYILATSDIILYSNSVKLGVLRLSDKFLQSDPLSDSERYLMEGYIEGQMEDVVSAVNRYGYDMLVGTSGTMHSLIEIASFMKTGEIPDKIDGIYFDREYFQSVLNKILSMTRFERTKLASLNESRVDSIVSGAVLVNKLLDMFSAKGIIACNRALREGMVVNYIATHIPGIRLVDSVPDLRRRSVIHLAKRFQSYSYHVLQVAKIAKALFSLLKPFHKLNDQSHVLLEYSAILMDIGFIIDAENHHKHGAYLIRNSSLPGFSSNEIELLAQAVRYHRKGGPKIRHEEFANLSALDKHMVKVFSGILKLSTALDRSHLCETKELKIAINNTHIDIYVKFKSEGELELWTAKQRSDILEDALGVSISIHKDNYSETLQVSEYQSVLIDDGVLLDKEGLVSDMAIN